MNLSLDKILDNNSIKNKLYLNKSPLINVANTNIKHSLIIPVK